MRWLWVLVLIGCTSVDYTDEELKQAFDAGKKCEDTNGWIE